MKIRMKKAQIGSTDLFVAISIFTVLFVLVVLSWNNYAAVLSTRMDFAETEIKAFQLSNQLVRTPGSPGMWEQLASPSAIVEIGLAEKPNVISRKKAIKFTDSSFLSYAQIKDSFKLQHYNFTINITDTSGNIKYEGGRPLSIGDTLPSKSNNIVILRRNVLYENENAILKVVLWKK